HGSLTKWGQTPVDNFSVKPSQAKNNLVMLHCGRSLAGRWPLCGITRHSGTCEAVTLNGVSFVS
ncbi:MAG: hypothetical protein LJE90_18110, partial [Betaproteobacteria bacterium]|nr:hypothetical protein [Betaproteobacteria bacterium]